MWLMQGDLTCDMGTATTGYRLTNLDMASQGLDMGQ